MTPEEALRQFMDLFLGMRKSAWTWEGTPITANDFADTIYYTFDSFLRNEQAPFTVEELGSNQ